MAVDRWLRVAGTTGTEGQMCFHEGPLWPEAHYFLIKKKKKEYSAGSACGWQQPATSHLEG